MHFKKLRRVPSKKKKLRRVGNASATKKTCKRVYHLKLESRLGFGQWFG